MPEDTCKTCSRWHSDDKFSSSEYPHHGRCELAVDAEEPAHYESPIFIVGGHDYYGAALLTHRDYRCAEWLATTRT